LTNTPNRLDKSLSIEVQQDIVFDLFGYTYQNGSWWNETHKVPHQWYTKNDAIKELDFSTLRKIFDYAIAFARKIERDNITRGSQQQIASNDDGILPF